jgi:hypothetical protein
MENSRRRQSSPPASPWETSAGAQLPKPYRRERGVPKDDTKNRKLNYKEFFVLKINFTKLMISKIPTQKKARLTKYLVILERNRVDEIATKTV